MPAQQRIRFDSDVVQQAGVMVTPASDAGFEAELLPFLQNPRSDLAAFAPIRPYSLIIRNTSSKNIAAISLRWDRSFAAAPPNHEVMDITPRHNAEMRAQFATGEAYLVFPSQGTFGNNVARTTAHIADRVVREFSSAETVTILVDAIILDDGRLVGPDKGGMSVQYETERQAILDTLQSLQTLRSLNKSHASFLQQLAAVRPQPTNPEARRDVKFNYDKMRLKLSSLLNPASIEEAITTVSVIRDHYPALQKAD